MSESSATPTRKRRRRRRPATAEEEEALSKLLHQARRLWKDHLEAEQHRDWAAVHQHAERFAAAEVDLAEIDQVLTGVERQIARLDQAMEIS